MAIGGVHSFVSERRCYILIADLAAAVSTALLRTSERMASCIAVYYTTRQEVRYL